MLAQDRPKSHGMTAVFKDHGEKKILKIVKRASSFNRDMRILPITKYIRGFTKFGIEVA